MSLRIIKSIIKHITATVLYWSGAMHLISRLWLKNKVVVLMYHRILTRDQMKLGQSHPGIIVRADAFEKQMNFLKKYFNPLSIDEYIDIIVNKKSIPPRSCLITFDDGWNDNYENASQILLKYKIPAIIFLTTDFIGTRKRFWQEKLRALLTTLFRYKTIQLDAVVQKKVINSEMLNNLNQSSRGDFQESVSAYIESVKHKAMDEIERLIDNLEMMIQPDGLSHYADADFIDWEKARKMVEMGIIRFGSHGCSHQIMTKQGTDLRHETVSSKDTIEKNLNTDVLTFSYPNGNYNQECKDILQTAGYKLAFTTKVGWSKASDNCFEINRINVHQTASATIPLFFGRILKIW